MSGITREQAAALGVPAEVLAAAYPGAGKAERPAGKTQTPKMAHRDPFRPAQETRTGTQESRTWTFVVEGTCVPKERPRVTEHGTVTPPRTRAYEALVSHFAQRAGVDAGEGPASLLVLVWTPSRRRMDLDNVLKAVCDALVAAGGIKDDTCQVLRSVAARWCGVDKDRPRIEVTVTKGA